MLVVDDSRTMRRLICAALASDPMLEVVAEAASAAEARDAINSHHPDVMTLDVEMPQMSGLDFLRRVMRHRPMPVVMVSTLTARGSDAAIEALAIGAVDCVEKPGAANISSGFAQLAEVVRVAAKARVRRQDPRPDARATASRTYLPNGRILAIGGSTGAVEAIERILSAFPANCPPTLITQHMPGPFLKSFATRLAAHVAPMVRLAEDGMPLEVGQVLIAPGGGQHLVVEATDRPRCRLLTAPPRSGHCPSVDMLFEAVARFGDKAVCAILTGMGRDGAEGLLTARQAGAETFAQSAESCVVFGMPRVAGDLGGVLHWADLSDFPARLLAACGE